MRERKAFESTLEDVGLVVGVLSGRFRNEKGAMKRTRTDYSAPNKRCVSFLQSRYSLDLLRQDAMRVVRIVEIDNAFVTKVSQ